MGFEDEVKPSLRRPCRQTNGRSKRTYELTSSIVPRGTSFQGSCTIQRAALHEVSQQIDVMGRKATVGQLRSECRDGARNRLYVDARVQRSRHPASIRRLVITIHWGEPTFAGVVVGVGRVGDPATRRHCAFLEGNHCPHRDGLPQTR